MVFVHLNNPDKFLRQEYTNSRKKHKKLMLTKYLQKNTIRSIMLTTDFQKK
jgi:hypothetical protein